MTGDGYADDVIVKNPSTGDTLYANMAGGSFQGWGRVASPAQISGLCHTTCVVRGVATVDGTGYQAVLFQDPSNGTTYRAHSDAAGVATGSPSGFTHWGAVANNINNQWQAQ